MRSSPASGVYDVGYCSEDSFGASAWFVTRPDGNLLIDSPRFTEALAGPFAELGGIAHVLLTHRDDVADAQRWAERFGSRVWIHADDAVRGAVRHRPPRGRRRRAHHGLARAWWPTRCPGTPAAAWSSSSTTSSASRGDSLAWSQGRADLTAFRGACWYSWTEQTAVADGTRR